VRRPVSIVTVTRDGYFFVRLLVEKVREFTKDRDYEIVVVDRGSRDSTLSWLSEQSDVRIMSYGHKRGDGHGHGEAAEHAVRQARHERIVLLDSDAHPMDAAWLENSVDRLDAHSRLVGAHFGGEHRGNPYKWYVHPHFMCFFKADLGTLVVLRKVRGEDTDTGEEATIRVLDSGRKAIAFPLRLCEQFAVGQSWIPSEAGGVFHAWYVSRLEHQGEEVARETKGAITDANYRQPLMKKLRRAYKLAY
jgi:glycosyltransferase involved in cell wall biosynthesis